jgi:hypothetical protein
LNGRPLLSGTAIARRQREAEAFERVTIEQLREAQRAVDRVTSDRLDALIRIDPHGRRYQWRGVDVTGDEYIALIALQQEKIDIEARVTETPAAATKEDLLRIQEIVTIIGPAGDGERQARASERRAQLQAEQLVHDLYTWLSWLPQHPGGTVTIAVRPETMERWRDRQNELVWREVRMGETPNLVGWLPREKQDCEKDYHLRVADRPKLSAWNLRGGIPPDAAMITSHHVSFRICHAVDGAGETHLVYRVDPPVSFQVLDRVQYFKPYRGRRDL